MKPQQASLATLTTTLLLTLTLLAGVSLTVEATHSTPVPVAWWKLDETSGTVAEDSAGTNDGTLCGDNPSCTPPGGPTVGAAGPSGLGTAHQFDGVDDFVTIPDAPALDLTIWSATVWANLGESQGAITSLVRKGSQNYFIRLSSDGVTPSCSTSVGGASHTVPDGPGHPFLTPGTWTHIGCVYDGNTLTIYVNGAFVQSETAVGTSDVNDVALIFGGSATGTQLYKGLLGDVRIYDTALAIDQIARLAQTQPTSDAGPDQPTPNPGATVTLAGCDSDDDAGPITYAWTQTAGETVTLSATNTCNPTFTMPHIDHDDPLLAFQLSVSDGTESHADSVSIGHVGTFQASALQPFFDNVIPAIGGFIAICAAMFGLVYSLTRRIKV